MLHLRLFISILSICPMVLGAGAASAQAPSTGSGQDYPNKPIRVVTSQIGGGSDFVARLVANGLTEYMGQQVIVDNRPAGIVPGEVTSRALPDGYTVLLAGSSFWTYPLLGKVPYDITTDFLPVTIANMSPNLVVVNAALPVKSVKELLALAKAKPGELNYASGPTGGGSHLAVELFKYMAGTNIVRIAYKGGAVSMPDLIGGRVQMTIDDAPTLLPHVKSGKLRALAIATAEPSPLYPDLPTVSASGVPGYVSAAMQGMFAPAKTPDAIIRRLNQETVRVLSRADVKEKFVGVGAEVIPSTPEQLGAWVKAERERLGKVIKETGIKVE